MEESGEKRLRKEFTAEQLMRMYDFIMLDDLEFYEQNILNLTDQQQKEFLRMNPDFMSDYPWKCDKIELLKDEMFRGILKKIKRNEEEK